MAADSVWYRVGRLIRDLIVQGAKGAQTERTRRGARPQPSLKTAPTRTAPRTSGGSAAYDDTASPGQFGAGATRDLDPSELQRVQLEYAPNMDRDPDPGEVVWTWVPYVENDGRGKDRPVLIIGRLDATAVVGCYISTKKHRGFVSIGRGDWDPQHRESFLSPERLLRVTHNGMRREGSFVERGVFDQAVRAVLDAHRSL